MPFEPTRQVEFEQHRLHDRGRQPGLANDFVDGDRSRPEQVHHPIALVLVGVRRRRRAAETVPGAATGRNENGRIVSSTSAADWISTAPSRIRLLQPCARGSSGDPGTAMTSRPNSVA